MALKDLPSDAQPREKLLARGAGRAGISLRDPVGAAAQRALLEGEGVVLDARGRVDLARFGWRPRRRSS